MQNNTDYSWGQVHTRQIRSLDEVEDFSSCQQCDRSLGCRLKLMLEEKRNTWIQFLSFFFFLKARKCITWGTAVSRGCNNVNCIIRSFPPPQSLRVLLSLLASCYSRLSACNALASAEYRAGHWTNFCASDSPILASVFPEAEGQGEPTLPPSKNWKMARFESGEDGFY